MVDVDTYTYSYDTERRGHWTTEEVTTYTERSAIEIIEDLEGQVDALRKYISQKEGSIKQFEEWLKVEKKRQRIKEELKK